MTTKASDVTTTATTTTQRALVKDMSNDERIAYLAGLVGKPVRYALLGETAPLFAAYGEHAATSIEWHTGTMERLALTPETTPMSVLASVLGGKPVMRRAVAIRQWPALTLLPTEPILTPFGDLYDVKAR